MSQIASSESAGPVPLHYAPDPRRQRWQRRGAWALIAFTIVMAVWFVYANRTEIDLRYRRSQLARLCLAHVTPPGTKLLVYENASALVRSNPDYMIDADPTIFSPARFQRQRLAPLRLPNPPAGYIPAIWKQYAALDPRTAAFSPLPTHEPIPMNFLGERYTPSGKRRLIAIAGAMINAYAIGEPIANLVLPVPGLLDRVDPPSGGQALQQTGRFRAAYLEPATADPNDRTHLTIDFTIPPHSHGQPERKGVLDVYLQNDDTLDFKVRDPATTQGL